MPLVGEATATATTTTMTTSTTATNTTLPSIIEKGLESDNFYATPSKAGTSNNHMNDDTHSLPPVSSQVDFDQSQCLFCTHTSQDLSLNMTHMSKAHGLHIDPTNLLVDTEALLVYLHLVIFEHRKCLYCGTQRGSYLAAQQHMMAKGHCKYDVTGKDLKLRELFDIPSDAGDRLQQYVSIAHASEDPQASSRGVHGKKKASKRSENPSRDISTSSDQSPPASTERSLHTSGISSRPLVRLSTRGLKQEYTLNNQLAQLRADDQRSLSHLPASEQRALLLTNHKQTENARRLEQKYRGNLESAGNKFNCLGKIRLIRKPPHTGNVHSLNR
jgi:pre-60S factor REI1